MVPCMAKQRHSRSLALGKGASQHTSTFIGSTRAFCSSADEATPALVQQQAALVPPQGALAAVLGAGERGAEGRGLE